MYKSGRDTLSGLKSQRSLTKEAAVQYIPKDIVPSSDKQRPLSPSDVSRPVLLCLLVQYILRPAKYFHGNHLQKHEKSLLRVRPVALAAADYYQGLGSLGRTGLFQRQL